MRRQSTIACALCGEREGDQLLKWLPWGQIQTRLVASAGKKTAVYCCFCGESALWTELPVNYLVLIQDGGKGFLGTRDLAVYEMACWIMLWQLSIPRQLQTGHSSTEVLKFRKNFKWPAEGYRLPSCQHQDWNTRLAGLQSKVWPHLP